MSAKSNFSVLSARPCVSRGGTSRWRMVRRRRRRLCSASETRRLLACGHPDANDADHLAEDPIHTLLLGRNPGHRRAPGVATDACRDSRTTSARAPCTGWHGSWPRASSNGTGNAGRAGAADHESDAERRSVLDTAATRHRDRHVSPPTARGRRQPAPKTLGVKP